MSNARFIVGDTRAVTASLPDASVDLVLTSPPFLALRSYLPDDHPDKADEIGSEGAPARYLDVLLDLAVEWRRVLAPHGSIAVELGDTYAGSEKSGSRSGWHRLGKRAIDQPSGYRKAGTVAESAAPNYGDGWPLPKSLCGIPTLFAWSLAYGRNLLTGEPSEAGQWRVRNLIAWCRPNPPVGALGDKFRPGTSYMTIATVAPDRYFDLDAVRTPHTEPDRTFNHQDDPNPAHGWADSGQNEGFTQNPGGAPPLDWWSIPTEPYKGAHYATWPTGLLVRPILSMTPQRVCTTCGKPSRRISTTEQVPTRRTNGRKAYPDRGSQCENFDQRTEARVETIGWTDCGHDTWRTGVVLDPFAGSGTTLAVATGHGRDAIGIDLDERNADLARDRVGFFLTSVEHFTEKGVA